MLFEVTHVNSSICSAFRKRNKTKSCGMGRPCFDEGGHQQRPQIRISIP